MYSSPGEETYFRNYTQYGVWNRDDEDVDEDVDEEEE